MSTPAVKIPEVELWKLLNLFKQLTIDNYTQHAATPQKSFLYDIFGINELNEKVEFGKLFPFFEQSVGIFINDGTRQLNFSIGYNLQKANTPSIHIILPNENPITAGIGANHGYQEDKIVIDENKTYATFTANSSVTYNLLITSDNANEVVLLYHWLKCCFLSMHEQIELRGLQNGIIGGSDISISDELVPPAIFYRNFNFSFTYDWTVVSLLGNRYQTGGITVAGLVENTIVDPNGTTRCPTLQEQVLVATPPVLFSILTDEQITYFQTQICTAGAPGSAVLKDEDGNILSTTPVPSGGSADIEAPNADYQLLNSLSDPLDSGEILSGGSLPIVASDAVVRVRNTVPTTLSTNNAPAGATTDVVAPNGTVQREDSAGLDIGAPIAVPSGTNVDVICPDGTVLRDGLPYGTVKSNGTIDVISAGGVCADATYQLKDSANVNIGAPGSIASGANANITAPDGLVNTTDGATPITSVKSNGSVNVPQSVVKYKDEANADAITAASDTEYVSGTMRPSSQVPRRELLSVLGVGTGLFATLGRLIANSIPAIPNVRIAKRDGTTIDVDYVKTPTAAYTETVASNVITEHIVGTTYNKPSAANYVGSWVVCVGAGGGGGAGARRGGGTQKNGGGYGGGGTIVRVYIPAVSMPSSSLITIGTGGTGGPGQTVNTLAGVPGNVGGDTSFGALVVAKGGGAGSGGGFGASNGGTNGGLASACTPAYGPNSLNGQQRGIAANGAGVAGLDGMNGSFACPSGGQGAGTAATDQAGGAGGGIYDSGALTAGPAGGAAGSNNGTNGADGVARRLLLDQLNLTNGIGTGGSGGGGANTNVGGNGGNGGNFGAGGGGGGCSFNGFISGAGGNGANGLCIVMDVYA